MLHRSVMKEANSSTPKDHRSSGAHNKSIREKSHRASPAASTPAASTSAAANDCSEGNDDDSSSDSPIPSPPTCLSLLQPTPTKQVGAGGSGRCCAQPQQKLEEKTGDKMSKEKQKFFRSSAFYAEHHTKNGKCRKTGNSNNNNRSQTKNSNDDNKSHNKNNSSDNKHINPHSSSHNSSPPMHAHHHHHHSEHSESVNLNNSSSPVKQSSSSGNTSKSTPTHHHHHHSNDSTPRTHLTPETTQDIRDSLKAAGIGQLKNLFDGLSHLFAAPSETRKRATTPNYSLTQRSKKSTPTESPNNDEPAKVQRIPTPPPPPPPPPPVPEIVVMSPSKMIKTAVKSKKIEQERRKELRKEVPFLPRGSSPSCSQHDVSTSTMSLLKPLRKKKTTETQQQSSNRALATSFAVQTTGKPLQCGLLLLTITLLLIAPPTITFPYLCLSHSPPTSLMLAYIIIQF
jgi:hypothetical protein